jgi:hypothetical protein
LRVSSRVFENEIAINQSVIMQITLLVRICPMELLEVQSCKVRDYGRMSDMNYPHKGSKDLFLVQGICLCGYAKDISVGMMCLYETNICVEDIYV